MKFLQILLAILAQVPTLVQAVEPLFGPKSGEQKLATVTSAATTIAAAAGANGEQTQLIGGLVSTAANATVAVLNATGVFTKEN